MGRLCARLLIALSSHIALQLTHAASASNSLKPPVLPIAGYGPSRLRRAADWSVARRLQEDKLDIWGVCTDPINFADKCSAELESRINEHCQNSDLTHYNSLGAIGSEIWIRGMNGLAGMPFTLLQYLAGEVSAVKYAMSMWVWYIFLAIALVWVVVSVSWAPAFCCKRCRRCYAKCFCNKCFPEKSKQSASDYPIRPPAIRSLLFALALVIFVGALLVLSFWFSFFLWKDIGNMPCSAYKTSYAALFGDTKDDNQPQFAGLANAPRSIAKMSEDLWTAVDTIKKYRAGFKVFDNLENTFPEGVKESFRATRAYLAFRLNVEFREYNAARHFAYTALQCLPCEMTNPSGPLASLTNVRIENLQKELTNLGGFITGSLDNIAEMAAAGSVSMHRVKTALPVEAIAHDALKFASLAERIILNHPLAWVSILSICIAVPSILVFFSVSNMAFVSYLWGRRRNNHKAHYTRSRNCCTCLYSFMGIILLTCGILILVVSQPGAELCKVMDKHLLEDNEYWKLPSVQDMFERNFANVTQACMTRSGNGDLITAATLDLEEKGAAGVLAALEVLVSEIGVRKEKLKVKYQEDMKKLGVILDFLLHILVAYKNYPATAFETSYSYASSPEILFGGFQEEDVIITDPDDPRYPIVKAFNDDLVNTGRKYLAPDQYMLFEMRFKASDTSAPYGPFLPKSVFLADMKPRPHPTFYGWKTQVASANKYLSSSCLHRLCWEPEIQPGCILIQPNITLRQSLSTEPYIYHLNLFEHIPKPHSGDQLLNRLCLPYDGSVQLETKCMRFSWSHHTLHLRKWIEGVPRAFRKTGKIPDTSSGMHYSTFRVYIRKLWDEAEAGEKYWKAAEEAQAYITTSILNPLRLALEQETRTTNCKPVYNAAKGVTESICSTFVYHLGMIGFAWAVMALAALIAAYLMWRVFVQFLRFRAKYYSKPEVLLGFAEKGDLLGVEMCYRFQDPKLAKDGNGNTALHLASYFNHPDICASLLKKDVDPDEDNNVGFSPLHVAVTCGASQPVRLFVEAGADVSKTNWCGDKPLHAAARAGEEAVIEELLIAEDGLSQPPRNIVDETPMNAAHRVGRTAIAERLKNFFSDYSISEGSSFSILDEETAHQVSYQRNSAANNR